MKQSGVVAMLVCLAAFSGCAGEAVREIAREETTDTEIVEYFSQTAAKRREFFDTLPGAVETACALTDPRAAAACLAGAFTDLTERATAFTRVIGAYRYAEIDAAGDAAYLCREAAGEIPVPIMLEVFSGAEGHVKLGAALCVLDAAGAGALPDDALEAAAKEAVRSPFEEDRALAAWSLRTCRSEGAVALAGGRFAEELDNSYHDRPSVRAVGALCLGWLGEQAFRKSIADRLEMEDNPFDAFSYQLALALLGDENYVPIGEIRAGDRFLAESAIEAAARSKTAGGLDALRATAAAGGPWAESARRAIDQIAR